MTQAASPGNAYADAGVDIAKGDEIVRAIAPLARRTFTGGVLGDIGGFGSLFKLQGYREPVLVASADGVGTKLRLAAAAGSYASAGADIVNHSINDVWVQGADPLFFLDYVGAGKLDADAVVEMVRGMADACADAGCALIGGETAEMPGVYAAGDYDVVGFLVGAVERYQLVDGSGYAPATCWSASRPADRTRTATRSCGASSGSTRTPGSSTGTSGNSGPPSERPCSPSTGPTTGR